ncbi:MAG: hypothetical protein QW270_06245 [Candidatus Bathyarchaeia archaeon]
MKLRVLPPLHWQLTGAITHISTILKNLRTRKIIFSIDQDDQELNNLKTQLENEMKENSIHFSLEEQQNRLYIYNCSYVQHQFEFIVAINGLNASYRYSKHTIEDHLLSLFMKTSNNSQELMEALEKSGGNPKEAWRLLKRYHDNVYFGLLNRKISDLQRIFPQQIESLRKLESKV